MSLFVTASPAGSRFIHVCCHVICPQWWGFVVATRVLARSEMLTIRRVKVKKFRAGKVQVLGAAKAIRAPAHDGVLLLISLYYFLSGELVSYLSSGQIARARAHIFVEKHRKVPAHCGACDAMCPAWSGGGLQWRWQRRVGGQCGRGSGLAACDPTLHSRCDPGAGRGGGANRASADVGDRAPPS